MNISKQLTIYRSRIDAFLQKELTSLPKNTLSQAMKYSILNGGKRLRPALVYIVGKILNAPIRTLDVPACAIELIHCYSLIHDDLPAMDDDDLRRGKPTCHKVFGDAVAILAGDALQALSFEVLTNPANYLSPSQKALMANALAKACGANGMVKGQAMDILSNTNNTDCSLKDLTAINRAKTSMLIEASIELGIIATNCDDKTILKSLRQYAKCIGLSFQIHDDILDIESNKSTLGKNINSDLRNNKRTYPAVIGKALAKEKLFELQKKAVMHLKNISLEQSVLADLASFIISRKC